jgi:RNA polymerase sigma factor (TIGR02999 family)
LLPSALDLTNVAWQERAQFFAICAQMMRRILVAAARARGAQKRGAGAERVNAEGVELVSPEPQHFVIALEAALEEFPVAPRQARVIELRYFGGLDEKEIAEALRFPAHCREVLEFRKIVVDARAPLLRLLVQDSSGLGWPLRRNSS